MDGFGDGIGRVLFLDIDGVLRPAGWRLRESPGPAPAVCPARLGLLNRLRDIGGLGVVLTSSWRVDPAVPSALAAQGLRIPFHGSWRTTLDAPAPPRPERGWQVDRWLAACRPRPAYAIVDDEDDFEAWQGPALVLVDREEGLTPAAVDALAARLGPRAAHGPAHPVARATSAGTGIQPRFF